MDVPVEIEQLVTQLERDGRLVDARPLTGGVSASVYRVDIETSSGTCRRVVFRQHPGVDFKQHGSTVIAKEYHLLSELHSSGLPVPQAFLHADSPTSGPYLVMEWIDGSTELTEPHVGAGMDEMARFLVDLHALDPASLHLPEVEPIEDPHISIVPYLPSTDTGRTVEAWLGSALTDRGTERPAVLHGDYWPGNVLWRDGQLVAVIDWEDATYGDPVADLATARLELLCRHGADAMDRFTAGYLDRYRERIGSLRLDSLAIWELYASASSLGTMGAWGLDASEEIRRREHTQRFFEQAVRRLGPEPAG